MAHLPHQAWEDDDDNGVGDYGDQGDYYDDNDDYFDDSDDDDDEQEIPLIDGTLKPAREGDNDNDDDEEDENISLKNLIFVETYLIACVESWTEVILKIVVNLWQKSIIDCFSMNFYFCFCILWICDMRQSILLILGSKYVAHLFVGSEKWWCCS